MPTVPSSRFSLVTYLVHSQRMARASPVGERLSEDDGVYKELLHKSATILERLQHRQQEEAKRRCQTDPGRRFMGTSLTATDVHTLELKVTVNPLESILCKTTECSPQAGSTVPLELQMCELYTRLHIFFS